LASASFFYKDLQDPIEDIVRTLSSISVASFKNAPTAYLYGFELEGRKNFGFVGPWLADEGWLAHIAPYFANVNLNANVSWIQSEVDVTPRPGDRDNPTDDKRSLQGQAPFTVNVALDYDFEERGVARLLYSTQGRSIAFAGFDELPNIYQEQRNQLDLVFLWRINPWNVPLNLKLAAENVTNDAYRQTQGDFLVDRFRNGVTFTTGLSYVY
jgi:hypothetical protein